ncbi:MAG: hypothetical protein JWP06_959 [Candidatus Saccharibacteria bacterium]|nr:hypothetical protein [Candidatus Saccharibacteria bacterium]
MAVVFDAVGPSSAGTAAIATSLSWSHTCSGSNRLLVVGLGFGGSDSSVITTATYNSVPMVSAGKVHANNQTDGYVELFYLVAPATGANTVAISCNVSGDLIGGSVSFVGVNQSAPVSGVTTNFGNGVSASLSVPSNVGDMVVDAVACGNGVTSSGQTNCWLNNFSSTYGAANVAQSTAAGATSVPMSYAINSDWWGMIGLNVVAATFTPPTFVTSQSTSSYTTTGSTKSVSVTTQVGDRLVVYGGGENEIAVLSGLAGNGITFTLQQSDTTTGFSSAYVWTGTDTTGGTNWTLTCNNGSSSRQWGFTCLVFRNSDGFGASNKTQSASGAPSLGLTTTQANSAVVVFSGDWLAVDGSSRIWRTVNGVTPSIGNGLEKTYATFAGGWTAYGAYHNNVGAVGTQTVGLSAPGAQKYNIVAVEVLSTSTPQPVAMIAWLIA